MEAAKASFFYPVDGLFNPLILESIPAFLANSIQPVQNMGHLGGMDPADGAVINVSYLKELVQLGMFHSSLAEDDLPEPPVSLCIRSLAGTGQLSDNHELTRFH